MKKIFTLILITFFSSCFVYSQSLNDGRLLSTKPLKIDIENKNVVNFVNKSFNGSDSDNKNQPVLKSSNSVAAQLIADDLIVQGSLGIGIDMTNPYTFGFNTFVLRENNLRILFDDTSNTGSFPSNDWILQANDSQDGGSNYFAIRDETAGRNILVTSAGAPQNSLFINDIGKVGFGTSTPSTSLHVSFGDTPALRLDQTGASGWAPYTWDIAGNETNFFIRDVTDGSKLPFRIQPGAPSNTLTLRTKGYVGIGTWAPETQLHVVGNIKVDSTIRYAPIDTVGIAMIEGTMIMDSLNHVMKFYNGKQWVSLTTLQYNSLSGNNLAISGSDSLVDLSQFLDNTDNQLLNLTGNSLSIEDGNSIDLSGYVNSDNQAISLNNNNNILKISGSSSTVDLSKFLDNSDDQILMLNDNLLRISGTSSKVDLSPYLDNTDVQEISLAGNTLSISGSETSVDLSAFLDNTDSDEQTLSLTGNELSIENGNSVDLTELMDNTDEQILSLDGSELSISNGNKVDLAEISMNTDEQTLTLEGATLSISNGNSIDLSSLVAGQQNQILELNTQIETLTQELADLKELVATIVGNDDVLAVVKSSTIDQNIPNPFSTTTVIPFNISNNVKNAYIAFYSQQGQIIKTVQINERGSGSYTFVPESNSQIYLYALYVDGMKVETKKMIYSK